MNRHTSYEVCGLKSLWAGLLYCWGQSHLVWGVWIEITDLKSWKQNTLGHTSYEVCGLKCMLSHRSPSMPKRVTPRMRCVDWNSWCSCSIILSILVTPRMRCVDWNYFDGAVVTTSSKSHLVWGVWIELEFNMWLFAHIMNLHLMKCLYLDGRADDEHDSSPETPSEEAETAQGTIEDAETIEEN